jgi:hypothetical protein
MKRRIGFVIEQALEHVVYGMGLKQALAARDDIELEWIEIPYDAGHVRQNSDAALARRDAHELRRSVMKRAARATNVIGIA